MDNTTKACRHCYILSCLETLNLQTDDKNSDFKCTKRLVRYRAQAGCFNKLWILFTLNIGRQHWIFLGLLNLIFLNLDQSKHFTGYFYYDSLGNYSQEQEMNVLNALEIILVYANYLYGRSTINKSVKIQEMVFDKSRFARIKVPMEDHINQDDSWNCGIYAVLAMMEMALVHCEKYQEEKGFIKVEGMDSEGEYLLKPRNWFSLFKNPKAKKKTTTLPANLILQICHNIGVLW